MYLCIHLSIDTKTNTHEHMISKSVSGVEILQILACFLVLHTIILPSMCSNMVYSIYFRQEDQSNISDDHVEVVQGYPDLEDKLESEIVIVIMTTNGRKTYRQRTLMSVYREVSLMPERYQIYLCTGDSEGLDEEEIPSIPNLTILQPCKNKR